MYIDSNDHSHGEEAQVNLSQAVFISYPYNAKMMMMMMMMIYIAPVIISYMLEVFVH